MAETGSIAPDANTFSIQLPPSFDRIHRQALHHYLQSQEPSSGEGWSLLIQTMDL